MPRYIRDEKVERTAKKLLARYPKMFGFIDPNDVYVVRDVFSVKHSKIATIGIINPQYAPFFPNPGALIITIRQCNWLRYPKNTRYMILYHEFMHIDPEIREKRLAEGYRYITVGHDMEEFYAFIAAYGPHWLRRKDLPNIMKERIHIKRAEEVYPEL